MKKSIFLILSILFTLNTNAQRVDVKKDIVYAGKEAVCKFFSIGTITNQAYTVKNMIDEELILIDQSQLRDVEGNALLRFMFADMPEMEAFMPVSFSFRKQMSKLLVSYNLIEKGKLVRKNVERFCKNYNGYFNGNRLVTGRTTNDLNSSTENAPQNSSPKKVEENTQIVSKVDEPKDTKIEENLNTTKVDESGAENTLVERDPEQEVFLNGNTIRQDFKDIGFYTSTAMTVNGKEGYLVSILDINNEKVAEAKFANDSGECELTTLKDNKVRQVTVPKSDMYTVVKDIVSKLCFLLYI